MVDNGKIVDERRENGDMKGIGKEITEKKRKTGSQVSGRDEMERGEEERWREVRERGVDESEVGREAGRRGEVT